jgi:hypothetical protein
VNDRIKLPKMSHPAIAASSGSPNHVLVDDHEFTKWPLNSTRGSSDACNLQYFQNRAGSKAG